jgi:hypothetical protein
MNEGRNQGRFPKPQATRKHPDPWQPDLNPDHQAGQNIGQPTDARIDAEWTAFHLRKRGIDLGGVNDEDLKQVPVLSEGERLQQGATYVDLRRDRHEFTARGDMTAGPENAYVPKDRVPYQIWNRLIDEPDGNSNGGV